MMCSAAIPLIPGPLMNMRMEGFTALNLAKHNVKIDQFEEDITSNKPSLEDVETDYPDRGPE